VQTNQRVLRGGSRLAVRLRATGLLVRTLGPRAAEAPRRGP